MITPLAEMDGVGCSIIAKYTHFESLELFGGVIGTDKRLTGSGR